MAEFPRVNFLADSFTDTF